MQTTRFLLFALTGARLVPALSLNVTAITGVNDVSVLQCWQMNTPFESAGSPGTVGGATAVIGETANMTYTVLPAGLDGGLHNAPVNQ